MPASLSLPQCEWRYLTAPTLGCSWWSGQANGGLLATEFIHHHSLVTLQGDISSKHSLTVWLSVWKAYCLARSHGMSITSFDF